MYVRVVDGEVVERTLPRTGYLSDGQPVSNYHQLSPATLSAEGWVKVQETNEPDFDLETQYTSWDLEIQGGQVVQVYTVHELPPPPAPEEEELVREAITVAVRADVSAKVSAGQFDTELLPFIGALFLVLDLNGVAVKAKEIYRWNRNLVEVLQDHTTQPDWAPEVTPALFKLYFDPAEGPAPWIQPTGGHDAYNIGDKVLYNDVVYTSKINGNTTVPGSDDRWWEVVL